MNVMRACAFAPEATSRSAARMEVTTRARIMVLTLCYTTDSSDATRLTRGDGGTVDFGRHASSEQIDRQHETSFAQLVVHENAFEAGQRAVHDADAIAVTKVRVREHRNVRVDETLNRVNLGVGNRRQTRPSVLEDADDASHLEHLDVAVLVNRRANEQVTGKHRNANDARLAGARGPHAHFGEERGKALG